MDRSMKVDIYVLNYNGKELLVECLPSICEAAATSIYKPEITIIDNQSTDDSEKLARESFPQVAFRCMDENRVLSSFSDAAKNSDADVIFFLNNDIKVDKDFIDPMVEVFKKDKNSLMVSSKFYSFDGSELECTWFIPQFRAGVFRGISAHLAGGADPGKLCYTFQSGIAAFDRKKVLNLGGYDDIYLPGRIEDTDLCFRGWKRGYRCYYQPESVAYHKAAASFKKAFKKKDMLILSHRNIFIFTWKNITDKKLLLTHILLLPLRLIYSLVTFKSEIFIGFIRAFKMLPRILKRRKAVKKYFLLSDRKVFALFTGEPITLT